MLPNLVDAFTDLYSNYSIKVIEANADELSKCLKSDIVDLIIDVEMLDLNIFNSIKWASENIILAVPSQFHINKKLQEYKLSFEQIKTGEYLKEKYKSVNLKYFKEKYNINIKLINQSSKNKIRRSGIVLSNIKLKNLGWNVKTSLREGIAKTLKVFEEKK